MGKGKYLYKKELRMTQNMKFTWDRIKYSSDQNLLKKAAFGHPHHCIRIDAIRKISCQETLFAILKSEKNDECLVMAADRLVDRDLVKSLFIGFWPPCKVIEQVLHRVEDDQDLFSEIIKRHWNQITLWGRIIPRINRRKTLLWLENYIDTELKETWNTKELREEVEKRLEKITNSIDFILD